MLRSNHPRRYATFTLGLMGIVIAGCDPTPSPPPAQPTATTSPSTTIPKETKAQPIKPADSPAATPAPSPSTQPVKPAPAPEANVAADSTAEPDISKLPDRTQRLIRDTRKALADAPSSGDLPTKLGMIYLTNDLQRESIPLFRLASERVPSQMANWYYLGIALAETQDAAGAIAAFQKAVSLEKNFLFAHLRLADLLLDSDKKDEALAAYQEVDRLGPTAADTLVRLAKGYDKLGKPDEALSAAQKAVDLEPQCPLGHAMLADLLDKKGDDAGAKEQRKIASATSVCNTPPDMLYVAARAAGHPVRAGIMRGLALASQGNYEIAIKGLKQLSRDDPMNLEIPLALGRVYQMQGNLAQAQTEYGQVLLSQPDHLEAVRYQTGILIGTERFADAEKTLKRALSKHPDQPELLQLLGAVQARTNRVDEAMQTYRRAIELKKDDPNVRLEFARLLRGIKRYADAEKELEPLTETPLYAKALIQRGGIKADQGDSKGAEEDLRAAVAADSTDPEPFTSLGVLFASVKQYDKAIAILEDGIKRHPNDVPILNALAWLLATAPQKPLRNGARAAELATKCAELTHYNIHGYLDTLGAAYAEIGRFEAAVIACQQAKDKAAQMGDRTAANEYEMRLNKYKSHAPYHMPE